MFECDTVLDADGNIDDQGMQCLRNQLAAARAEAERWRRRHDALRAAVIKAEADYASRADGLDDALMILRQLLAEAGR